MGPWTSAMAGCMCIIGCVAGAYCLAWCSEWMFYLIRKYSEEEAVPLPTQVVPLHARPVAPTLITKPTKVQPKRKYVVILNPNEHRSLGSHIV